MNERRVAESIMRNLAPGYTKHDKCIWNWCWIIKCNVMINLFVFNSLWIQINLHQVCQFTYGGVKLKVEFLNKYSDIVSPNFSLNTCGVCTFRVSSFPCKNNKLLLIGGTDDNLVSTTKHICFLTTDGKINILTMILCWFSLRILNTLKNSTMLLYLQ